MKIKIRPNILICLLILIVVAAGLFTYFRYSQQHGSIPPPLVPPPTTAAEEANYTLQIPEIDVTAPIILDVNGADKETYNKALEGGVAQLSGTALPGRFGNTFIFGHSSFYTGADGDYKEVFKDLNDLEAGDQVSVESKTKTYTYRVSDKQIVSPNRVDLAEQNLLKRQLTLMTCWPIGSNTERLVVIADLISQK